MTERLDPTWKNDEQRRDARWRKVTESTKNRRRPESKKTKVLDEEDRNVGIRPFKDAQGLRAGVKVAGVPLRFPHNIEWPNADITILRGDRWDNIRNTTPSRMMEDRDDDRDVGRQGSFVVFSSCL